VLRLESDRNLPESVYLSDFSFFFFFFFFYVFQTLVSKGKKRLKFFTAVIAQY